MKIRQAYFKEFDVWTKIIVTELIIVNNQYIIDIITCTTLCLRHLSFTIWFHSDKTNSSEFDFEKLSKKLTESGVENL